MIPYSKLAPSPSPALLLAEEVLQLIAAKLTDTFDYNSFRCVCASWRRAAKPGGAPKQLPWLLLPYNPATDTRSFYSISTAKTYTFDCPASVVGGVVCGSSFGWLAVIAPDSAVSLWNPVTNAEIGLPPPTGFPSYLGPEAPRVAVTKPKNVDEHCILGAGYIRTGYPCRVSLSSSPAAPDCIVIVILVSSPAFAYCRIGDQAWTIRETNSRDYVDSVVLRDGKFYTIDVYGTGFVLGVDDPSVQGHIRFPGPSVPMSGTFVTKGAGDNELYIVHCYEGIDDNKLVRRLNVLRLVSVEGGHRWERMSSIGDLTFFLSGNHTSVVRASDFPRCAGNLVYFSEHTFGFPEELPGMYVYNIERDSLELELCQMEVVSGFSRSPTWLMPSLLRRL